MPQKVLKCVKYQLKWDNEKNVHLCQTYFLDVNKNIFKIKKK